MTSFFVEDGNSTVYLAEQVGWLQTWDHDAPLGPLHALDDNPEDHADDVADESLVPVYRLTLHKPEGGVSSVTEAPPPKVLYRGPALVPDVRSHSFGITSVATLKVPPGSRVLVVEDTEPPT